MIKGLLVPPGVFLQKLIRANILSGHTDAEVNKMFRYIKPWSNEDEHNNKIDRKV